MKANCDGANCGNGSGAGCVFNTSLYMETFARARTRPNHRAKLLRRRLRGILLRLAERAIAIRKKPNDAAQQFQHETPKAERPSCTDSGRLGSLANCRSRMLGTRANRMELADFIEWPRWLRSAARRGRAACANTFLRCVTRGVQPVGYFTLSCEGIPLPLQSGRHAL